MNPQNSRKEDIFERLYKNLFSTNETKSKTLEELTNELNDAGIDTSSYYSKVDTLVNQYKTQCLYDKANAMRESLLKKFSSMKKLSDGIPASKDILLEKLQSLLGNGQAQMALRNYEFTDVDDMKSLLETLEMLEELDNKNETRDE